MMFDDDENDYESKREAYRKLPIFIKGQEISDMVRKIGELIPEENEHLQEVKGMMLADAAMLTVKIAGAEGGGLYDIKMEAAAIIRKSARDLMLHYHSLKMFGFKEYEYFIIVKFIKSRHPINKQQPIFFH